MDFVDYIDKYKINNNVHIQYYYWLASTTNNNVQLFSFASSTFAS